MGRREDANDKDVKDTHRDVKDMHSPGWVDSARRKTGVITSARSGGPGCREQAAVTPERLRSRDMEGGVCAASWPIVRREAVGPAGRRLRPVQFQPSFHRALPMVLSAGSPSDTPPQRVKTIAGLIAPGIAPDWPSGAHRGVLQTPLDPPLRHRNRPS